MPEPVPAEEQELRTEWEVDEEGGGPVKTFLEHLEDLRWTLIKCIVAVMVSMVACLMGANTLVSLLTWPLRIAHGRQDPNARPVDLYLGGHRIFRMDRQLFEGIEGLPWTTNQFNRVDVKPIVEDGQVLFSLQPDLEADLAPAWSRGIELKNYSPIEGFVVALQLMLYGGLVLASPFVIFFLGQFVLPAMKIHEKKFLFQTAGFGAVLFILGIAFCYFVLMQIALVATVQFSQWLGFTADEWRAADYVSFVCKLMLAMGLSFQLPVVILTMVKIGLLDYGKLTKFRPYWIVVNLSICAIVTPTGDPFTMVLMAAPLQFLYEISVFVSKFWESKEKRRMEAEANR